MAFEEANETIFSERSNFSENQEYKHFVYVAINPYVSIFRGLDECGGRK